MEQEPTNGQNPEEPSVEISGKKPRWRLFLTEGNKLTRALVLSLSFLLAEEKALGKMWTRTGPDGVQEFSFVEPPRNQGWVPFNNPPPWTKAPSGPWEPKRKNVPQVNARKYSPDLFTKYDAYFKEASQSTGIPVAYLKAIVMRESTFDPLVVSNVGARGLGQLSPDEEKKWRIINVFDPRENIFALAKSLRAHYDKYPNDWGLIAACHNAGPGEVARAVDKRSVSAGYVRDVLAYFEKYKKIEEDKQQTVPQTPRPTKPPQISVSPQTAEPEDDGF